MNEGTAAMLIEWYRHNHRALPWRETRDPYLIWISEIILQQTRVVQGLDYYYRFTERFPDVRSLAEAPEDEVMKLWQGLGYYSRARNLHTAARDIMERFGGNFPTTYDDIRSLKGVGEYTAAAIASFAFQLPYPTVDGNVYRVLSRLLGIDTPIDTGAGKKYFTALAGELMQGHSPLLFNQAMMEFGALQCVPKSPACGSCPLVDHCVAYAQFRVTSLPVKQGKVQVKERYFNYLHIHCNGVSLLAKRTGNDIWRNLYEFPLLEADHLLSFQELQDNPRFQELTAGVNDIKIGQPLPARKHVLTHRIIHARFFDLEVSAFSPAMRQYLQVPREEWEKYAVSRLMEEYREKC